MLSLISGALSAISAGLKATAAYLGLVHDAREQQSGVTQQIAADQAATIKGDADARKIEARNSVDDDAALIERMRAQREAVARR